MLFLELPSLLVITAENQRRSVTKLNDLGVAIKVISLETEIEGFRHIMEDLWDNKTKLHDMVEKIKNLNIATQEKIKVLLENIVDI